MCLQCRRSRFNPWVRKIPCKRAWQPTPVSLPGESHGQRSLVGYSSWDHKEGHDWAKSTAHISDRRLISKYLRNSYNSNKLNLEKAEEPEVKLPTFAESEKKQGKSRKASTSVSLTTVKTLTVWVTTNCGKFFKRWEYQTLTCLPRNLFAGQEVTVTTRHGTTGWFKIGKGVCQGCILSPCLT